MTETPLSVGALGCAVGLTLTDSAGFTALHALKIAKRRLRPQVRDGLIGVWSTLTDETFIPTAWRFSFTDRATRGHVRKVIVAAHLSSEHPDVQEAFKKGTDEASSPSKLIREQTGLLDSDEALARVRSATDLSGYSRVSYRLSVEKGGELVWRLSFCRSEAVPVICYRVRGRCGTLLPIE